MSLLFETIKIKDKQLCNIDYHNQRLNYARSILLNAQEPWDLLEMIPIPENITAGVYKCRIEYGRYIEKIECIPYVPKNVEKLFIIHTDSLDYPFKYTDRTHLLDLKERIPEPDHHDILIVKNGWITDTSFSNIVFFDGKQWVTPNTALLKGTKRQFYLDHHMIEEQEIRITDRHKFSKARLINAMLDLENGTDIFMDKIL
jgi:4-amino-4-deoxychorismate lyase